MVNAAAGKMPHPQAGSTMAQAQDPTPALDRVASATLALLLPALACTWLLRGQAVAPAGGHGPALQVAWIVERPRPPPAPARLPPPPADAARPRTPALVDAQPADAAAHEATTGLTAVFLEQGRVLAREAAGAVDFGPAGFDRPGAPPRADGRFRMREPMSAAAVVSAVGAMLNPGYERDPCPRIRANLADLGRFGDADARTEEARRLQRLCR